MARIEGEGITPGEYAGRSRPAEQELQRLQHLARRLNPGTQRCLRERGIGPGWRCLEVGAAEGSMSRWLAQQVEPGGRVVAADIDLRFLTGLDAPNLEVRHFDLRQDDLELDHYDLAYCRTLMLHMPDAEAALRKLAAALRPGGWLVVQEPDAGATSAADLEREDAGVFEQLIHRAYRWTRDAGVFDPYFGRSLPRMFDALGLEEVGSEGTASIVRGSSDEMAVYRETVGAMLPMLRANGVLSEAELETLRGIYRDPDFAMVSEIQVAAWGRKPG